MSNFNKTKLDKFIKKTKCTKCNHLISKIFFLDMSSSNMVSEYQFEYFCKINKEDEVIKNKYINCSFFKDASKYRLKQNKNVYNNYVKYYLIENNNE